MGEDLRRLGLSYGEIKPDGTGHRKNHLAYGLCRASTRKSTNAFITTQAWIDLVKENLQK